MVKLRPISFPTIAILALFLSFGGNALANNGFIKLQAAIFFKVLNYDSGVKSRGGNKLVIGIVVDKGTSGKKSEISSGFAAIVGSKVSGKPISVKVFNGASAAAAGGANIMYLPDGTSSATASAVISLARSKKIPVFAGSEALVKKGAAVGVTLQNKKPQILVNLIEAKKQGMVLPSQLLKLAKIIK